MKNKCLFSDTWFSASTNMLLINVSYFCIDLLYTALLQPDPPATMIIDEPELGKHPYAIELLAELIDVLDLLFFRVG